MHKTLTDALAAAANTERGIHFVAGSDKESFLSYRELRQQSLAVLAGMQARGVQPGDELVLQFTDLRALILAYWACLAGRIVPVPLELGDQTAATEKVFTVWRTLGQPWLATDAPRLAEKLGKFAQEHDAQAQWEQMRARLLQPIEQAVDAAAAMVGEPIEEDIAFIQYSSGSTGSPKGVTMTHGNLLTNIGDILHVIGHAPQDRFLTWKPITHDFGMIAFHLAPIVAGSDQVRLSTDAFIWNPALWFAMVDKYRANILGSPNFGYRHFLKLFRRGRGSEVNWDLSCVKVILNGAEPISQELCSECAADRPRFGLPPNAMTPGYGLAEGSLIVSLCPVAETEVRSITVDRRHLVIGEPLRAVTADAAHAARFVDCGLPYPRTEVRITDAARQPLSPGHVGHIEIRGGAVTRGYYRNERASAELIAADGWLNTQDLGVMLDGRLHVVGRVKEMIVIGGVNYFPHDIEQAILQARGESELNKYIAVGVPDEQGGSEALLVFVYHRRADGDFAPVALNVRQVVLDAFGLTVAHVLPAAKIPKTTSGKVQRFRLVQDFLAGEFDVALAALGESRIIGTRPAAPPQPAPAETELAGTDHAAQAIAQVPQVLARTQAVAAQQLGRAAIDVDAAFFDLGFTSLRLLNLKTALEDAFGIRLDSSSPLDFPTVRSLAQHIATVLQGAAGAPAQDAAGQRPAIALAGQGDIAIVAVACRFPGGADTPQAYWRVLAEGIDPVTEVPADRWQADPQAGTPITTRQGGFLPEVDGFDPLFFGISAAEAVAMDPQQRLLLEVAHEAIENAGWNPQALGGTRTGVFVGISGSQYAAVARDLGHATGPYTFTGTMFNAAAGRIAYAWGLQGPCMAVDTACSSSLVAVQLGMRELRAGSCDAVLAGGVNLILRSDAHVSFSQLNALAESGRCRSFDEGADGYIRGEGCGLVLLKRLADAQRDGDPILAVIKGAAVNHNGRSGGLTVPSGPAQERLIRAALDDAGVLPADVDYVEAHGSGTRLGDPQELGALGRVFKERARPLRLGSVKSNLGHLESAAGVAGLIKLALMLERRQYVANLHFAQGNSLIDWASLPLSVVAHREAWPAAGRPRVAGISSFGISGTNAHLVLSEYQQPQAAGANTPAPARSQVFTLSAKSAEGLRATAAAYAAREDLDAQPFDALCQTVNRSRSGHAWRFACEADSFAAVRRQIAHWQRDADELALPAPLQHTVFLFTGQGSVYPQVARRLYDGSTVFRAAFDRCDALFADQFGAQAAAVPLSLKDCLLGDGAGAADALQAARVSQALIFSVEHALVALWASFGVRPTLVLGHSIGEYAAACTAGVMSLEDAVRMVALRGSIMDDTPADGAMAGLLADESTVRALLEQHPDVFIAAINTPENVTVSGRADAVAALLKAARKARIFPEPLPMRHAFHSPLMAAGAERLAQGLGGVRFHDPAIALVSSQTGRPIARAADMDAAYWSAHLCQPVRFRDALGTVLAQGATTFVEIGGSAALSGLAAQIAPQDGMAFLPSLREGRDDWAQLNQSLAALYRLGHSIDWNAYHEGRYRFVAGLPNTAYQRSRYWFPAIDAPAQPAASRQPAIPPEVQPAARQPVAPTPMEPPTSTKDLQARVVHEIRDMIGRVTGFAEDQITPDAQIFELGIDSLMLMQLDKRVQKRFGVDIPVKQFFTELDTPARIGAYIASHMAAERRAEPTPPEAAAPAALAVAEALSAASATAARAAAALPVALPAAAPAGIEALLAAQLDVMRQQLALLRGEPAVAAPALPAAKPAPAQRSAPARNELRGMTLHHEDIDARQLAFVRGLVDRVVAKTPKSKAYTQRYRGVFADWIATLNYSLTLKEMAYPLVAQRSRGSRFWDIDGNEYIDTATGYGATFFGHNPDFIVDAIRQQLDSGMELGPQSALAGEVAERICRLTGAQRAAFCNSGTEAVMVAVRLARAVTGRAKIVRFINSYHGSFDAVLAEAGEDGPTPVAPGIVESMIQDTVVLAYGSPASLQAIRELGGELAAVLVEPVQSRAPHNHSPEYLRALREVADETGAALIFDEMITGFRIQPGGLQAHYGIRADITTYGKVIGGGMPIGVVAGQARFMDAIDGGAWQFGDDSGPTHLTTFFAGTFCKHPLAMAAARAVLRKLEEEGEALMARVNALTRRFCERANAWFAAEEVPIEAQCFGSLYRFETRLSQDPARSALEMNLLFRLMMLEGVFVWERRTSFFSTAHTEEDADRILDAVRKAVQALRAGGFGFRAARRAGAAPAAVAQPVPAGTLSSEERRMYVLSLMKGGEYAYHVTGALRFTGAFDTARCEEALSTLARRHPMLRASYAFADGVVARRIDGEVTLPLLHLAQDGRPLDALLADVITPFDLTRAPLWQTALIQADDGSHVLALDFHHLIADGISMSVLIEEFLSLYRGESLAPATAGYTEFVRWEQGFAASPEARRQLDAWLARLQPVPAALALPADFARPAHNDFAGASHRFVLGPDLQRGVRELARAQRATPFMVLFAAYFVWLHKLTQQADLCVGTPFDRRGNGAFDRTVGMFAQTLVIRVQVGRELRFADVVGLVRQTCMDAYDQPNCPLDELVGALNLPRDFSRNPLFDTMFIFENGDRRVLESEELRVDTLPVPSKGSAFDLTLEITEQQGLLHAHFIYARRLFEERTVQRWARYFEHLLRELLAEPSRVLARASLLDASDCSLLLEQFNATQRAHDRQATIVTLWRQACGQSPDLPALVAGGRSLSYAELDAFSDTVARHLRAHGAGRGACVGILLPRGPAMIAAMLGVLKAGAAYVPLDPEYPTARIAYMLGKSGIGVLLSDQALSSRLEFTGIVLDPDRLAAPGPQGEDEAARPGDLAYVIFTSGSTGDPKGVMIEHASVVNFLSGMAEALALPPRPVTLGLTTISFDIFVLEVFLTFAQGGTLVLADEQTQRDPVALGALMWRHGVNLVQATPSRVQALLATQATEQVFGGVQTLLVGGEAFPRALLPVLQAVPGLRLFNVYGPTETTVWSAVKDLTRAQAVTLGRPIANTRAYVLDEERALLPIGSIGDLWIAGEGLARGYFGDAQKTADAFVDDPFHPGQRMYRTGDRAAWTADGELIYHGRTDNQIKLRGYRIEVQEIEAVLQRHPAVGLAAVAVRELSAGNPVLVAYCELRPGVALAPEALQSVLRDHAAQALPAYMVPGVVMQLEALPLTPNGKIDRRALPAARAVLPSGAVAHSETADVLEAEILGVWKRILGERAIGLHDSFFDVGGNSFSLVSLHAQLNERYPGVLEVADIFANPTVAALKARIAASLSGSDMPMELSFPAQMLNAARTPVPAETISASLEPAQAQQFMATATSLDAQPYELAVALFGLYLNKLVGERNLEIAVGVRARPEYVLVSLDFGELPDLRALVEAVRDQHRTDTWVARKLVERDGAAVHQREDGVRPLLLRADGGQARYGFDLALRLELGGERLALRADYDSSRLLPAGVRLFVANYLAFVKALVSSATAKPSLG